MITELLVWTVVAFALVGLAVALRGVYRELAHDLACEHGCECGIPHPLGNSDPSWSAEQDGARTYGARTVRERQPLLGGAADRHVLAPRSLHSRGGRVARPAAASGLITQAPIAANQVQRLASAPSPINGSRFRSLGAAVNRELQHE